MDAALAAHDTLEVPQPEPHIHGHIADYLRGLGHCLIHGAIAPEVVIGGGDNDERIGALALNAA